MISWRAALLLLPVLATGSLIAQQTLIVGPGQPFADVQSAINASAPGDTIAVRPLPNANFYAACSVGHSLTIRSDPLGARARVAMLTANLGVGARVHVQEMDFLQAAVSGGLVTLEGVLIWPSGLGTVPALVATQSNVVLRRYSQNGMSSINNSSIAAIDSQIRSPVFTIPEAPAMTLNGSVAFFANCTVTNGNVNRGSTALQVNAGSRADLVDCAVQGTPSTGMPWLSVSALIVDVAGLVRHHRTTFSDGAGGSGITGTVQTHTMLGASLAQTQLLVGGSMTVNFHAEPLDPVFVLATFQLDPPTLAPLVEPEQWGFAANGFLVTAVFANAAGIATFSTTFANNPALRGRGLWLMGASGLTFPLPLSVPVGGLLQ
jgi:hypothetical protein